MAETEEQASRAKEAVEAMKHAKATMTAVLERNLRLERELHSASSAIATLKSFISPGCYTYPISGNTRKCVDVADDAIASIAKVLS